MGGSNYVEDVISRDNDARNFETLYIQIMEIQCRTDDNYLEIFNQMIVMFGRIIHAKHYLLLTNPTWHSGGN